MIELTVPSDHAGCVSIAIWLCAPAIFALPAAGVDPGRRSGPAGKVSPHRKTVRAGDVVRLTFRLFVKLTHRPRKFRSRFSSKTTTCSCSTNLRGWSCILAPETRRILWSTPCFIIARASLGSAENSVPALFIVSTRRRAVVSSWRKMTRRTRARATIRRARGKENLSRARCGTFIRPRVRSTPRSGGIRWNGRK